MKTLAKSAIALLGCISSFAQSTEELTPVNLSADVTNFSFCEGPAWDGIDNIFFTDITAGVVRKYNLTSGDFSIAYSNSERANGLMFNKDNKLTVCQGSTGSITLREVDGTNPVTLVSTFNGEPFNGPNDLCYDKRGGLYFTDPRFESPITQPSTAIYYRQPDGTVVKQDDFGTTNPNGIIISPDGLNVYANNTSLKDIYKYDIDQSTGALSNRVLFGELPDPVPPISQADGMAVDTDGKLYVTAKSKVHIYDGSQLEPIQTINFPEKVTNCTFGGSDMNLLFVTGATNLYQVDLSPVIGIRHPFDLPEVNLSVNSFFNNPDNLKIYPNPIDPKKDTVAITLANSISLDKARLYNSASQLVDTPSIVEKGNIFSLKLSESLTTGNYFLTLETSKGDVTKQISIK